jgi:hypothetical protein
LSSSSSGLRPLTFNAKLGIGAGLFAAFLAALLGTATYFDRRKRIARKTTTRLKGVRREQPDYLSLKPELDPNAETRRHELHGEGRRADAVELDAEDISFLQELGTEPGLALQRSFAIKGPRQSSVAHVISVQHKSD